MFDRVTHTHLSSQVLDLACNPLTTSGTAALCPQLRRNTTLQRLDMYKCSVMCKQGLVSIALGVAGNRTLLELDIRDNELRGSEAEAGAATLVELLKVCVLRVYTGVCV